MHNNYNICNIQCFQDLQCTIVTTFNVYNNGNPTFAVYNNGNPTFAVYNFMFQILF